MLKFHCTSTRDAANDEMSHLNVTEHEAGSIGMPYKCTGVRTERRRHASTRQARTLIRNRTMSECAYIETMTLPTTIRPARGVHAVDVGADLDDVLRKLMASRQLAGSTNAKTSTYKLSITRAVDLEQARIIVRRTHAHTAANVASGRPRPRIRHAYSSDAGLLCAHELRTDRDWRCAELNTSRRQKRMLRARQCRTNGSANGVHSTCRSVGDEFLRLQRRLFATVQQNTTVFDAAACPSS